MSAADIFMIKDYADKVTMLDEPRVILRSDDGLEVTQIAVAYFDDVEEPVVQVGERVPQLLGSLLAHRPYGWTPA